MPRKLWGFELRKNANRKEHQNARIPNLARNKPATAERTIG